MPQLVVAAIAHPFIAAATAAAVGSTVASTQAQQSATKKASQAQEQAMAQQTASQEETRKQILGMEAKSKADAEQLKQSATQSEEIARKDELRKRVSKTKTLLTGPQGVLGEASIEKKVLLGA